MWEGETWPKSMAYLWSVPYLKLIFLFYISKSSIEEIGLIENKPNPDPV